MKDIPKICVFDERYASISFIQVFGCAVHVAYIIISVKQLCHWLGLWRDVIDIVGTDTAAAARIEGCNYYFNVTTAIVGTFCGGV